MKRPHLIGNKHRVGKTPWNKGKKGVQKASESTIEKLKDRMKGNSLRKGKIPWNKGKTSDSDDRIKSGENASRWDGGKAKDKRTGRKYLEWRSKVFERDNWTCQTCRKRGVYLEAHHIKSWAMFKSSRYDLENGVTLCKECHKLTDNYKGKSYGIQGNESNEEGNGNEEETPVHTGGNISE